MQPSLNTRGLLTAEVVNEPDQPISVLCRASPHHSNLEDTSIPEMQPQEKISLDDIAQEIRSHTLDVTSALTITNPYNSRGTREYQDSFLQQCLHLMNQSAYYVRYLLACHKYRWSSCLFISSDYSRLQRRLHGVRQRFLQSGSMDSDPEETAAVEAFRSLACLAHTRAGTDPSRFKKYLKLPGRLGIYEIVGRISRMYKVMKGKYSCVCMLPGLLISWSAK